MNLKIKNIIAGTAAMCCALTVNAQQISPMTKAVLNGYKEILNEDPRDYETLYERASTYMRLDMYNEALTDIIKAIDYTPAKEEVMKSNEFSLLADIYIQTKEYEKALSACESALSLTPDNYPLIYKKGNICLYLKKPEQAYQAFQSMQRLKSRSQESYFGMAKAAIMMNRKEEARALLTEAENADPSNYITYCRIGDLYADMHEDENAATNYLSAFSLTNDNPRPLESLIKLGKENYEAVATALQYSISRTTNKTPLYFLAGNIALATGNYNEAYDAFNELLTDQDGRIAGVYANMARTCLALNKLTEADTNADLAIMREPTVDNYLVKADVEIASGNGASALLSARKALQLNPASAAAMSKVGEANMILNDGKAAMNAFNDAVMTDPSDVRTQMLRAFTEFNLVNDARQSIIDYTRIANLPDESDFRIIMYQALAQTIIGKKIDADTRIKRALDEKENKTRDDYYYAAVYYSQTGDLQKGKEMLDKAISLGYQNMYNLISNNIANLNISPIRYMLNIQKAF